jgi:ABC-2 type transport system permease protein
MGRILAVARREYIERVRTKAFVIGTIVAPILIVGMMLGPALVIQRQSSRPLAVTVVDASGQLRQDIEEALRRRRSLTGQPQFRIDPAPPGELQDVRAGLREAILAGRLDGYVFVPAAAIDRSSAEYYGRNVSGQIEMRALESAVESALVGRRLARAGLDPARIPELTRRVDLKRIRVSARGERVERGATLLLSLVLMMILYITVLMWGQAMMTGVIEEKSNRVVEVIVSAMTPWQLFAGKLLGIGGAGLTQFLLWGATMVGLSLYGGALIPASEGEMPEITPLIIGSFVTFFLLGFFLYAAIYAAIGAAVNTVQEAQNFALPALMPLILSMVLFPAVLRSPDSPLAVGISLFPFATPLLMFLRIALLTPPLWQIALSIALTGLTIAAVTWVAGRVYRVGILMYGKRPTFPELLRWVRHA